MSEESNATKGLRDRFSAGTEDRLGRALSDLLENPLLTGAIGRAFDAREKASQAQEVAMGALNIPSAADIERLTRRVRAVSQRLEGIEDGVQRLDRAVATGGFDQAEVGRRLSAIEDQLQELMSRLEATISNSRPNSAGAAPAEPKAAGKGKPAAKAKATGKKRRG